MADVLGMTLRSKTKTGHGLLFLGVLLSCNTRMNAREPPEAKVRESERNELYFTLRIGLQMRVSIRYSIYYHNGN